jgi:hypothetical protein
MKYIMRLFVTFILTAVISSCARSSNVLLKDDFSSTENNWDQISNNDMTTDYYDNSYRILVNLTNFDVWANPDDLSFTDVHIEVDATKNAGPNKNNFGIICRYTGKGSYYYAMISSDGNYGINKKSSDGGKQLGMGGEQFSDKILTGNATNHIRFDCVGSTLTLYVNGTLIDLQTDTSYTEGNVGLIASAYTEPGTDIFFDNFFVYKPDSSQ